MPSNALVVHLDQLLHDAEELDDAYVKLVSANPALVHSLEALNRAAVVMCVSAWESYIEELVHESLNAMRPAAGSLGPWPAHNAWIRGRLGRFHNPNMEDVRMILSDSIGLPDRHLAWVWPNSTSNQAIHELAVVMTLRHQIAHGANPRPPVLNPYSGQLPEFFRRLGQATDRAVRDHLVSVIGPVDPRPP